MPCSTVHGCTGTAKGKRPFSNTEVVHFQGRSEYSYKGAIDTLAMVEGIVSM